MFFDKIEKSSLKIGNQQTKGQIKLFNRNKAIVKNLNFRENLLNFVGAFKNALSFPMKRTGILYLSNPEAGCFCGHLNLIPLV
jgi:hypothetical protein